MTSRERVLKREYERGRVAAMEVQERSPNMTGTELYAVDDRIPQFKEAVKHKNMLERHAGLTDGFMCRSSAGRVVRLLQNYDSTTYTAEPEEMPAQWGFVWSTDPAKALPFIALSTSPYNVGECCLNKAGQPKASNIPNNVFDPDENPRYWDDPVGAEQ